MRAALAFVLGLWLAFAPPACAGGAFAAAWSAEVGADAGRLMLVWPVPTRTKMALGEGIARLRAERPLAAPSPTVTDPLSPWLLYAATLGGGAELALSLRPGATARLSQPHPRLTVIELGRAPATDTLIAAPPTSAAVELAAPAMIEPAAGAAPIIPIPRSRPRMEVAVPHSGAPPATTAAAPRPHGSAALEGSAGPQPGVNVSAAALPGELRLLFRWGRVVPAAVFEHGQQLWVVFSGGDAAVAGWRSLDRADVTAWLEPVATTGAGGARVFRFRLPRPVRIEPRATDSGWAIAVSPAGDGPHEPTIEAPLERMPAQGALVAEIEGELVQLRNPDSGERLGVLLAPPDGPRLLEAARLVDLELLPSHHGLVWRLFADGISAAISDGRLTITRPGGLRLSMADAVSATTKSKVNSGHAVEQHAHSAAPTDRSDSIGEHYEPAGHPPVAPSSVTAAADPSAGTLGLAGLAERNPVGRQQARRRIVGDLHALAGLPRARARLDLARLYLADALGPEARTALQLIDDADLAEPAAVPLRTSRIALTGAAEALAGRHDPALASLLDHTLDEDAEIALWRAYAAVRAARWQLATQEWDRSGGLPEGYPDPLRRRLGLELATALLDHGEATDARGLLAQLGGIGLAGEDGARLRLLEGIAYSRDGKTVKAEAAFAAAAAQGDSDIATRAGFLLTSLRFAGGTAKLNAAIEAMNSERPHWRGHPWEVRMLTALAELQASAGRPAEAITTRREALARTADPVAASAARRELQRYLAAQLADGAMPVLARLALHQVHGELLDTDAAAPRLRAGLGQAAATAGLTESAMALVDAAGSGAESVGGNQALASALAARGDVDGALRRLGEVGGDETQATADLRAELRARAALAVGNPKQAAAALARSGSATARMLGREIAWRGGDWQEVAQTAGADLAATGGGAALSPALADAAVWLGLAQSRLGRANEAAAVAARYAARIDDRQGPALLRLATLADGAGSTPVAAARFAAAIRAELASLPPLAAGNEPDPSVRSASARSTPEG